MNITKSISLFQEAQSLFPGGVNSPVRAFRAVGGQPLFIERGEGPYLFDTNGKRYLDFASGVAVTAFGHAHPYLIKALTDQAHKVWHTSNLFRVAGQESLGRRLVDNTFADTVFFTNSGVEAWECAVKVVRKYQYETGHPERWRIITAEPGSQSPRIK